MSEFNYNKKANNISAVKRKLIYGVGINDADYVTEQKIDGKRTHCHFYLTWKSMIARCYSAKYQETRPTYIGCSVCEEWLTFSNFKEWMGNQDYTGKQLDKDILVSGNKTYSPELCLFVSSKINNLLFDHAAKRGNHPQGVCWRERKNKYVAEISINGKKKHLGHFDTVKSAEESYWDAKIQHIGEIAMQQTGGLKTALICWVNRQISIID